MFFEKCLVFVFHAIWQFWHYKSCSYIIKNNFKNMKVLTHIRHMVGLNSKFIPFFSKKIAFTYDVPYVRRYCKHFGTLTHTSKKIFWCMDYCCTQGTFFKNIFLSRNRVFFPKKLKKHFFLGVFYYSLSIFISKK